MPSRAGLSASESRPPESARGVRPSTFGSNRARMRSSMAGSRQKRSNASSKSACCSWRVTKSVASVACQSARRARPVRGSTRTASITLSVPMGTPVARSTRAKCTTFSASLPVRGAAMAIMP